MDDAMKEKNSMDYFGFTLLFGSKRSIQFDGSTSYKATNVTLDNEQKTLPILDTSSELVESIKSGVDFSYKLMDEGQKISSDMFICREE